MGARWLRCWPEGQIPGAGVYVSSQALIVGVNSTSQGSNLQAYALSDGKPLQSGPIPQPARKTLWELSAGS